MSIPPLVCSTPPPPEQCEDDKDHEDFDLTYNLSQEDDDDSSEYNYGNYSSYNIYSTKSEDTDKDKWTSNSKDITESKKEVTAKSEEIINSVNFIPNHNLFTNNYTKCEENTLEDLNLKVDPEIVHSSKIISEEYETETQIYVSEETSDKDTGIQDEGGTDILRVEDEFITISDDNVIVYTVHENTNTDDEIIDTNDLPETSSHLKFNKNDVKSEKINPFQNVILEDEPEISENINVVKDFDVYSEKDDFGDFEDFQFKNACDSQTSPVTEIPENPWGNDSESSKFGAFTANFDSKPLKAVNDNTVENAAEDDDDFGDFNDFKSSTNTDTLKMSKDVEIMLTSATNVPVLSLQSPESEIQIVDSINNVLTSIFTVEVSELEVNVDKNLESYLSETWGHLIDIDVRQPYMVNWNNSLGQKTLLKALCIDSRNILFGPKWNYNMPKYAVNLTAAPLQPQKQTTQSNIPTIETTEKVPSKEAGTWIDPFTPDGREYTYAEALLLDLEHLMATLDQMAHKHSTFKISELLSHACNTENENAKPDTLKRSPETDVFGDETSSKSNKIYSSTINVQPLRHINLPDTHIFTPTDSETPRSKTIHYDSASAVAPPLEAELGKNQIQVLQSSTASENENEYWDFQDFKGTSNNILTTKSINPTDVQETLNNANTSDTLSKAPITYQTQILQPIKLEPIMPTLNWPDPGEVKETFDDFSDFIMSTSRNNEKEISLVDTKKDEVLKVEVDTDLASKTENIDDEFETFQSAPMTMAAENCDNLPFNFESINSKGISKKPLDTSSPIISNHISGLQDFNASRSAGVISVNHVSDNILQPSNSTTSGISRTHNTGQILQPLSLESYSQINWPNPGIDLQDLSRFNPVNSVHSLKSDNIGTNSKGASPAHNAVNNNEVSDDDIWGDFVSSAPKPHSSPKKPLTFADDDEWTDFVSSPSIKPLNGLNTISLNVHSNLSMQKSSTQNKIASRSNQMPLDIPTLNYITPKSNNRGMYSEQHFQNL